MNKLLITELGDAMRTELIQQQKLQHKKSIAIQEIPQVEMKPTSMLFQDDHPLYRQSLSEVALLNLTRAATLSLNGSNSKLQLEQHIREDLQIKPSQDYINRYLAQQVDKIADDKNLMTKRRRLLISQLNKINSKTRLQTDQSQLSTIVEDSERDAKLAAIMNAEAKLLQMQRRFTKKKQDDEELVQQVRENYHKFKEYEESKVDSLQLINKEYVDHTLKDLYHNTDLSEYRYGQRMHDKHKKEVRIWQQHHFPKKFHKK